MVWLTGSWRLPPACHPRASVRTRGVGAGPAWKVARLRERSARRRVWVRGGHTGTVRGGRIFPVRGRLVRGAALKMAVRAAQEVAGLGQAQNPMIALVSGLIVGIALVPDVQVCAPGTHPRRRADRSFVLATFHAGPAPTPRVRRDARVWHAGGKHKSQVSPTRSARKMPRLGPDRHAQAPGRAATGLPSTEHKRHHRTRRGGEGHFLRNKRLL